MSAFAHRGIVEGFYGRPWSHEDRLWMIEKLGAWGMNRYLYAPKEDPLHRGRWREPYPEAALREFAELVEKGDRAGVDVGFAVSPGLSIRYSSAEDVDALVEKFQTFRALGTRFLSLALDDVPTTLTHAEDREGFESLAHAHASLTRAVTRGLGPDLLFWLVPTDYLGVGPTDYLSVLGGALDSSVEIGWTGRTIVSPTIEADEAAIRSASLKRRLLVWDNVPVADGPMRPMLHLGPYCGRDPAAAEFISGFLLNPMEHARASALTLRTAAAYLADPEGYDPEEAWVEAIAELGEGDVASFRLFAEAHRFSPLLPEDRDRPLERCFSELTLGMEQGRDLSSIVLELQDLCRDRLGVAEALRNKLCDRRLVAEIEPWLESHARETRRMVAAIDALFTLCRDSAPGEKVIALMRLEQVLVNEANDGRASYGPRRVLYPQLTSMREDEMGLVPGAALMRDRCLADDLVVFVEDLATFVLAE